MARPAFETPSKANPRLISNAVLAVLFLFFVAIYALTIPQNQTESWDRLDYLYRASSADWGGTDSARELIYKAMNRVVFLAADLFGASGKTAWLLTAVSILSGAGAIVFVAAIFAKFFRLDSISAVIGSSILGFSFGLWRFSVEVEVYAPAIFLIFASLYLLLSALANGTLRARSFIACGIVSGFAVSFYLPSIVPLFVCTPLLFSGNRTKVAAFVIYSLCGASVVLVAYVCAYFLLTDVPFSLSSFYALYSQEGKFSQEPFGIRTIAKALLAISHTLLSSHWVFGIDRLTNVFAAFSPNTEIESRIYAAARFKPLVYAPVFIAPIMFVLVGYLIFFAKSVQKGNFGLLLFFLAWALVYGAIALLLDPGVSEVWLIFVPTLVVFFTVLVIAPAVAAGKNKAVVGLVVLIALWNWFGGMAIFQDSSGDYYRQQLAWLEENATENDVLIVFVPQRALTKILSFDTNIKSVRLPSECSLAGMEDAASMFQATLVSQRARGGRVFALPQLIDPPSQRDFSRACDITGRSAEKLAAMAKQSAVVAHEDGQFTVYELTN